MSKQTTREKLVELLKHYVMDCEEHLANRILAIMAQELRDAFCNGAAYGWLHGYRLDETCEDAAKQALRRWPDKEE